MVFFPFLWHYCLLNFVLWKGWLICFGGVKAQIATGGVFSAQDGELASASPKGSPAMSSRRIHVAFSCEDDTILRFRLIRFNQAITHVPRHERRITRQGITITPATRHLHNQSITGWDDLQPLDRE
jgi:hypothetical protein